MWPELLRLLENRDNPDQTVETDVRAMLDAVRKGRRQRRPRVCPAVRLSGHAAPLRVPAEDLEQAARDIPAESLDCIKQAADNIRAFHEAQKIAHGSSPAATARSSARRSKLWTARAFMSPEGVAATRRSSRACS